MALHGTDAAVVAFGSEGSGRGGTGGEAGGVVEDVVVEEGVVGEGEGNAKRAVVVVALAVLAVDFAVGAGGLVGRVGGTYILLELTYRAVAFASISVGPLVIKVDAGSALSVGWPVASHTSLVA